MIPFLHLYLLSLSVYVSSSFHSPDHLRALLTNLSSDAYVGSMHVNQDRFIVPPEFMLKPNYTPMFQALIPKIYIHTWLLILKDPIIQRFAFQ